MELLRGGAYFRHYWTNVLTQHHKGFLSSLASALLCIGCFQAGSRPQRTMISGVSLPYSCILINAFPMEKSTDWLCLADMHAHGPIKGREQVVGILQLVNLGHVPTYRQGELGLLSRPLVPNHCNLLLLFPRRVFVNIWRYLWFSVWGRGATGS